MRIVELIRYPLKACRGESPRSVDLDAMGMVGDRRFMLVDREGNFLSQRQEPRLSLIKVDWQTNRLRMRLPNTPSLEVHPDGGNAPRLVRVWDWEGEAQDLGNKAARWWHRFLGYEARLVRTLASMGREVETIEGEPGGVVGFADGFPLLVVGTASLKALNARLKSPVGMDRFRPNVVVQTNEPFVEDGWRTIEVEGMTLHLVKPCKRCAVVNVDPRNARLSKEVLKSLADLRGIAGGAFFGQNTIHQGPGRLRVGAPVRVVETR